MYSREELIEAIILEKQRTGSARRLSVADRHKNHAPWYHVGDISDLNSRADKRGHNWADGRRSELKISAYSDTARIHPTDYFPTRDPNYLDGPRMERTMQRKRTYRRRKRNAMRVPKIPREVNIGGIGPYSNEPEF